MPSTFATIEKGGVIVSPQNFAPSPTRVSSPMDPARFLDGLAARGLALDLDAAGNLLLQGPKAARTDKIRRYVREYKPVLQALVRARNATRPAEPIPEQLVDLSSCPDDSGVRPLDAAEVAEFRALWEDAGGIVTDTYTQEALESEADLGEQISAALGEFDAQGPCQRAERITRAVEAARAGKTPTVTVQLASGTTTSNPSCCLLGAVARGLALRQRYRENLIPSSRIETEGLQAQIIMGEIDAIARWYKGVGEADAG